MRIGIGKIGKSVQFKNIKRVARTDKKMTAGGIDARVLFETLISKNPEHEFVLIGRSNYSALSEDELADVNVNKNVTDFWDEFQSFKESYTGDNKFLELEYADYRLPKMPKLDAAVFLAGGASRYSVVRGVNMSNLPLNVLEATKMYQGPVHYIMNETMVPYIMLVTDPRCFPEPFGDVWNMPKKIISQFNETMKIKHRKAYDDITLFEECIQTEYRGIESMYCIDDVTKTKSAAENFFDDPVERDIRIALFLNEGKPSRYNDVVNYVFAVDPTANVYGQWNADLLAADDRFKAIPMSDLTHLFDRIKYTFCIPIKKGWATGKFWEMTSLGIVPFFHPEYDTQNNIGFPEYLRVNSAAELKEKMDYLDDNPAEYEKIKEQLNAIVTPDRKDGTFINDMVMKAVKEII